MIWADPIPAVVDSGWVVAEIPEMYIRVAYDGDDYTDWAGKAQSPGAGIYASRYPMKVEWDFQPRLVQGVSALSSKAAVSKVEVLTGAVVWKTMDRDGAGQELKFSKEIPSGVYWNSRVSSTRSDLWATQGLNTKLEGFATQREDVDDGGDVTGYTGNVKVYLRKSWFDTNSTDVGGGVLEAPANLTVKVTDATGGVSETTCEYTVSLTPADPLCWFWQSNPGEVVPTVELDVEVMEDVPGQWDGGGTVTVDWWDSTQTVIPFTTIDLPSIQTSKQRPATLPMNPPPEETITVSLSGGVPAVNRSTSGVVQFQQDAGGAILSGNSDGCCEYEPFSLFYEDCPPQGCIFTGGGGCP